MSTASLNRITNEMRKDIVTKACVGVIKPRRDAWEASRVVFADALYAHHYDQSIAKMAAEDPILREYIPFGRELWIKAEGFGSSHYSKRNEKPSSSFQMSKDQPIPLKGLSFELDDKHPLWKKLKALEREFHAINSEQEELECKLRLLLRSVNTLKQLRAAWPEGEEFYPSEVTHSTALVPITLTHEINKMLGLKPKGPINPVVKAALKKSKA